MPGVLYNSLHNDVQKSIMGSPVFRTWQYIQRETYSWVGDWHRWHQNLQVWYPNFVIPHRKTEFLNYVFHCYKWKVGLLFYGNLGYLNTWINSIQTVITWTSSSLNAHRFSHCWSQKFAIQAPWKCAAADNFPENC